jgi:hypothetical protein
MIVIIAPPLLLDDSSNHFNKCAFYEPHRKISNFTLTHHPTVDEKREMIEGIGG